MKRIFRSMVTMGLLLLPLLATACEHSHIHLPR
jgi:hypothetical protein